MARTIIMGRGRVPCMTTVEQYTCGCKGNKTIEERQRRCPNCQKITDAAQQDALCQPPVTQVDMPIKCKKCERPTEEGKASPENKTVTRPEQDGSKTFEGKPAGESEIPQQQQQQQTPCTTRLTRFVCGCEKGHSVDRKPLCPRCHNISRAAGQDGSCRPWLTVYKVQRICDDCMLHIERRVIQPPRCLTAIKDAQSGSTNR